MMFQVKMVAAVCVAMYSLATKAQGVEVSNAWARTTVPGQKATGAFMTLQSKDGARLVSAASPVAGVTEVHEMKMENNIMRMRAMPNGLELPAGQVVELKPGGYHVMLMDLKQPLAKDTTVPITLVFKDAKGVETKTELKVPVSNVPPAGASAATDHHAGHGSHNKGMHHGK